MDILYRSEENYKIFLLMFLDNFRKILRKTGKNIEINIRCRGHSK